MRADLSIDRARSVLRELAASRLPSVSLALRELRLTEDGALRLPTGVATLSDHARRQLAGWLDTSPEAIPTDGDIHVTALVNARLAAASNQVCLRLERTPDALLVRAIVEPFRPSVGVELFGAVLAFLDDVPAYGVERGSNHVLLVARAGRRFDVAGASHEHGVAVSLDERGVVMAFAALFLPEASAPVLRMVQAMPADTSPLVIAAALRAAFESEPAREIAARSAQAELAQRSSLMAEVFLEHPAIPAEYVRRVVARLLERDASTQYDVVLEMLAHVDSLDVEAQLAVSWRAGDLLLIDE